MFVLAMEVQIHIPEARSLKDRRQVVKAVLEGAHRRFRVSVADIDGQDTWQRAGLGFAVVASTEAGATETLDAVERFVWSHPELDVLDTTRRWLE